MGLDRHGDWRNNLARTSVSTFTLFPWRKPMKRSQLLSLALSCAATLSLAAGLRAEAPGGSHVPPSIAAKKESPEIVAALKPMRDQLAADRKAYQAAMKS